MTLDYDHFEAFSRKQIKAKRSSPSGRHYRHYKTCAKDQRILKSLFSVLKLAVTHNVLLASWIVGHDLLLQKDIGLNKIHRWRNINLIEGDLQYVIKVIWAQLFLENADPNLNRL